MLLGGLIVSLCTACLVVLAAWRQVDDISQSLAAAPRLKVPALSKSGSGQPQTLLLIGSDQRFSERSSGLKGRSDTMLLVRFDPRSDQTTVLSVPRDFRTTNSTPQGPRVDKINAAYTAGGAEALVDTIKNQLNIPITHVFEVGLGAFSNMVDTLGCAWVDVDRRYYHSNAGLPAIEQYAEINIKAGYQKLCGVKALSYVRHRHDDSDLFRSARQQDFLRQLSSGLTPGGILARRQEMLSVLRKYVRTDLRGNKQVMDLLRSLVLASGKPVRQMRWPQHDQIIGGTFYLANSQAELSALRREFLSPKKSIPPKVKVSSKSRKGLKGSSTEPAGSQSAQVARSLRAPYGVYGPSLRPKGSIYADGVSRQYFLKDRSGSPRQAYRMVLESSSGSAFGVQGVKWLSPPLLIAPHSSQKVRGRTLQVYWDGKRIRLVSWQKGQWTYWVSNSLDRSISNQAMLSTAASLKLLTKPY